MPPDPNQRPRAEPIRLPPGDAWNRPRRRKFFTREEIENRQLHTGENLETARLNLQDLKMEIDGIRRRSTLSDNAKWIIDAASQLYYHFQTIFGPVLPDLDTIACSNHSTVAGVDIGAALIKHFSQRDALEGLRSEYSKDLEDTNKVLEKVKENKKYFAERGDTHRYGELVRLYGELEESLMGFKRFLEAEPSELLATHSRVLNELSLRQEKRYRISDGAFRRKMRAAGMLLRHEWE